MTLSGIFRDLLPLQTRMLAEASFWPRPPTSRRAELRPQACAGLPAGPRLRPGDRGPARLQQRRRRLRLQRQSPDRQQPLGRRGRARRDLHRASASPTALDGKAGQQAELLEPCSRRAARLPEPGFGRARRDHRRPLLRYPRRHQPRRDPRARGEDVPVYIGDQTRGDGKVRTLAEQVALETRTRMLNPKWYEGMLKHGYEGVRQIEVHVTNTMGWSATTGQVAPWVYERMTETFVLDEEMRERLAALNPTAAAKVATGCSRPTSATTGSPMTRRSRRCAAPARNSRTVSRASTEGVPQPGRIPTTIFGIPGQEPGRSGADSRQGPAPRRRGQPAGHLDPRCRSTRPRSSPSTARAVSARARPRRTCPWPSPSSASACCRSAATRSTTAPSR
jgi:hypothetical protein